MERPFSALESAGPRQCALIRRADPKGTPLNSGDFTTRGAEYVVELQRARPQGVNPRQARSRQNAQHAPRVLVAASWSDAT